ncbi:MAG: hypothetical protein ACRDD1_16230 [Planctomycetia bacterium]
MADPASKKKNKKQSGGGFPVPPGLIVGVIMLLLAMGGFVFDRAASKKAKLAYDAVVAKLDETDVPAATQSAEKVSPATVAEVEKLAGKTPDGPPVDAGSELRQTFTWRGVRTYRLYVTYAAGAPPVLVRVQLNQPFP